MADVAHAIEGPVEADRIRFLGSNRNFVPAFAIFAAGALAFPMGMAEVFFTSAIAWTFVLWGLLLIYIGLLDVYQTYEVTDEALVITNVLRPWGRTKVWGWSEVNRMDVAVGRRDHRLEDAVLEVYWTPAEEIVIEREDRSFDPELAQLIVDRAGLAPADGDAPADFSAIPLDANASFSWR